MQQPHDSECINVQQPVASLRRQGLVATVGRKQRSAARKMNQTFSGSLISLTVFLKDTAGKLSSRLLEGNQAANGCVTYVSKRRR